MSLSIGIDLPGATVGVVLGGSTVQVPVDPPQLIAPQAGPYSGMVINRA